MSGSLEIRNNTTQLAIGGSSPTVSVAVAIPGPPGAAASGAVTSVAVAVPTGLSVSGSPVTSAGTITLSYSAGYALPTIAAVAQGTTAYGWGNHAAAGYLTSSAAALAYQPLAAVLTNTTASFTTADETKLDGIEAAADVTDAGNVGSAIHGATEKTTPVDADTLPLIDSAASNVLKKVTWANIKATAKTYFDTLYQAILVSGTNIKTVNGSSLLGSGDLSVGSSFDPASPGTIGGTTPGIVNATKVAIASGTHTSSSDRVQSDTVTWNGSGQTMVAKRTNVTDTASAAGSTIEDWQVGGVTKARIDKSGALILSIGSRSANGWDSDGRSVFVNGGAIRYGYNFGTGFEFNTYAAIDSGSIAIGGTTARLGLGSFNIDGTDVAFARDAAGVGKITDGGTTNLRDLKLRNLIATNVINNAVWTVGTLPSASASGAGAQAYVTDANATLAAGIGTTVAAGGSNKVPVISDGTNWIIG